MSYLLTELTLVCLTLSVQRVPVGILSALTFIRSPYFYTSGSRVGTGLSGRSFGTDLYKGGTVKGSALTNPL